MNDAQLLERLTITDPCDPGDALPAAWNSEAAWLEVERLVGTRRAPSGPQRGWLVATAAFALVLLIGIGVTLLTRSAASDPPVTNTTVPRVTTTAPPTTEAALAVTPGIDALVSEFVAAYNNADLTAARALLTPGASVDFATWVDPAQSPSVLSLDDRLLGVAPFGESVALGACQPRVAAIACIVTMADLFTEHLRLEPSSQTWVFTIEGARIVSLAVEDRSGRRAAAMSDFDAWLQSRGQGAVLAGEGEWVRTEDIAEVVRVELVEYGALASGVSADQWNVVNTFYRSLSDGDVPAALALFSAGGTYNLAENDDTSAAPVLERGGPVADPEIRQQFIWWYDYLKVDWQPLRCVAGTSAGEVRCRSQEIGVTTLPLPRGVAEGLVVFTIANEGILTVIDHTLRGNQLRDWWRDWMEPNAPQYVDVWLTPTGPGQGAAPMTVDFANVTLELYPQYLAERGVDVPPEYLEGSLLPDDWVPRLAP